MLTWDTAWNLTTLFCGLIAATVVLRIACALVHAVIASRRPRMTFPGRPRPSGRETSIPASCLLARPFPAAANQNGNARWMGRL